MNKITSMKCIIAAQAVATIWELSRPQINRPNVAVSALLLGLFCAFYVILKKEK